MVWKVRGLLLFSSPAGVGGANGDRASWRDSRSGRGGETSTKIVCAGEDPSWRRMGRRCSGSWLCFAKRRRWLSGWEESRGKRESRTLVIGEEKVSGEEDSMCSGVSSLDHFRGTFDVDFGDVGIGWGSLDALRSLWRSSKDDAP